MKITGTFVWSASVEVDLANNATETEQREALDKAAMAVELDFKHPVLHECSNEDLID